MSHEHKAMHLGPSPGEPKPLRPPSPKPAAARDVFISNNSALCVTTGLSAVILPPWMKVRRMPGTRSYMA